jgi:RimJ/RimL family protein N-acetyltransferase
MVLTEGPDEGKQVGWAGIRAIELDKFASYSSEYRVGLQAEYECILEKDYRGIGWGTECLRILTLFAFEALKDNILPSRYYTNTV